MKVLKNDLTFDEQNIALDLMMEQDSVVTAKYVLIGYILDKCTDYNSKKTEKVEDDGSCVFTFSVDDIENVKNEFFDDEDLIALYNRCMMTYNMQLTKNVTNGLISAINGLVENFGSIDSESLTKQLEQTFVNLQKEM